MNLFKILVLSGLAVIFLRSKNSDIHPASFFGAAGTNPSEESISVEEQLADFAGHNLFVMAAAEVTSRKGGTPQMRMLAKRIGDSHKELHIELAVAAKESGVRLPTLLSKELKAEFDALIDLSRSELDCRFLDIVVAERQYLKNKLKIIEEQAPSASFAHFKEQVIRRQTLRADGVAAIQRSM
jgi:predicted outer membrane protein